MNCLFYNDGDFCVCDRCGHRTEKSAAYSCDAHHAKCRSVSPTLYLGDRVERWLAAVGITNRRIIAVKKRLGMKPTCGCQWRKEVLNRFDRWLRRMVANAKTRVRSDAR